MHIDALQYIRPSRKIFEEMARGKMTAIHMTVGYHEDFAGVCNNLQAWNRICEDNSDLLIRATSSHDIDLAKSSGRTAIFFGLQNPLAFSADLGRVELLHQMGIRFCQITYNQQSLLGAGCFEPNDSGLTAFGAEVISEMNRVGMIVDLSHAGHKTAMDAIDASRRPVTATHANPLWWHASPRNLDDPLLEALRDTGGMAGFSLYPHHLAGGSDCTLKEFVAMVRAMVEKYGSNMFGIGSDLCQDQPDAIVNWMRNGHWRKNPVPPVQFPVQPDWFARNSDFPNLTQGLTDAGLSQGDADKVVGGNWYEFLKKGLVPE